MATRALADHHPSLENLDELVQAMRMHPIPVNVLYIWWVSFAVFSINNCWTKNVLVIVAYMLIVVNFKGSASHLKNCRETVTPEIPNHCLKRIKKREQIFNLKFYPLPLNFGATFFESSRIYYLTLSFQKLSVNISYFIKNVFNHRNRFIVWCIFIDLLTTVSYSVT